MTTKVYRIPEQYEELVESMRIKIEMLQNELEKRDRLLDEANRLINTTVPNWRESRDNWLKQYEEMRLK